MTASAIIFNIIIINSKMSLISIIISILTNRLIANVIVIEREIEIVRVRVIGY